ncbi:zinc ribbon domain-containing protein [Chloroflexota bacterium]
MVLFRTDTCVPQIRDDVSTRFIYRERPSGLSFLPLLTQRERPDEDIYTFVAMLSRKGIRPMFYFSSGRYIIDSMDDDAQQPEDTLGLTKGDPEHELQPVFPCPKCGTQIPVGQKLCSNCGQHFEYRCRHCGAVAESLSGFCPNCGGKLYQQKQSVQTSAKKVRKTPKEEIPKRNREIPQPVAQVGRYLIIIVIIIFIGAILFTISTSPQGDLANWFGGSFTFGGKSPASTPPSTDTQQKPESGPDLPRYTTDQVIAIAKKASPYCRLPSRRTG